MTAFALNSFAWDAFVCAEMKVVSVERVRKKHRVISQSPCIQFRKMLQFQTANEWHYEQEDDI